MATYDLRYTIPSASQIAAGDILNAPYSANTTNVPPYAVTLPKGVFKLEVWGASAYASPGGRGGYAVGTLSLLENTATHIIPGRTGIGLNESGESHNNGGNGLGGDATDIRLLSNTLNNRIIVAGGGGGAGGTGSGGDVLAGGYGGGSVGGDGTSRSGTSNAGKGGTATAGGAGGTSAGAWGEGGNPNGGGGWYGGGSSYVIDVSALNFSGAGGGSGFVLTSSSVGNVPSSYVSTLKDSKYYLSDAQLIAGNVSMPNPAGGTETGHGESGYARITVVSLTPTLPAPTNLTTSNLAANSVKLTWTASSASGVSYKVYRGNTLLTTTTLTTYTDTGISPGGTYTFKVAASKTGYTDSSAATVTITNKLQLSAPSGFSASYTFTSTTITWGAVTGANAYKVWRGSTYIGQQTGRSYTDSSAGAATSYAYKVSAVDTTNAKYESAQASFSSSNNTPVPSASNLTYSNLTINSVKLTWTASSVSGVSYKVYRGTTLLTTTTSTTYTDSNIGPGQTYTYKVITTKSGYTDSAAITVSVTNKAQLATPSGISASYTTSATTISWNAVSGANAYKVWRGSTYIGQQTGRTYTDSSAGTNTSYVYKISAVDTTNAKYESAQASFTSSNGAQLATPTNLTASYTSTSTTISWKAVTNATAYKVWRGTTLVSSSVTTNSYTDSSAGANTSYTYKVSATASGYYESAQASISTSNKPQLSNPTTASASYTADSTTVSWSAVTGADGFKVYRNSVYVANITSGRTYTDTSAGAGTSYTYKIVAYGSGYWDASGKSITTNNKERLDTPTMRTTSYYENRTLLAWNAVTGADEYQVWRGSTLLATQSGTTYSDYGAGAGTSYTYDVIAVDTTAAKYNSEPLVFTTSNKAKLATPTGLTADYTLTQTTIRWNKVTSATSYVIYPASGTTPIATVTTNSYTDTDAGSGISKTFRVIASNSPNYYNSDAASITTSNPSRLDDVTNVTSTQTISSVTLSWDTVAHATSYVLRRSVDGTTGGLISVSGTTYTDNTTQPGKTYTYFIAARADGYYQSASTQYAVTTYSRLPTPSISQAYQTQTSTTLSISRNGTQGTLHLFRDGVQIATTTPSGNATWVYTDSGLESKRSYVYTVYTSATGDKYDSLTASLTVYVGKDYTNIERQRAYLNALTMPITKLCRLRFLYPNGATAFALDNNIKNRRSKAFIQDGTVNANMQNGQRLTASVTIANANQEFDFNINKIWFGQEVALDEGLVLPNGEEYWRQTGVFVIDNPQETINPNKKTVTYNLVDKWADLDGTLDGNLEGTYEVAVNTNIFAPITSLLAENRGNGRPVDRLAPVYTNYYNGMTQTLPDGTMADMVLSPYTLTIEGDGGTIGAVVLGLGGMVNAWVGYDNTGRLRIDPSQDDIVDSQKPVLYRFTQDEVTLLGMAYTIKKEDVYNDYIVVGEQMDDYSQPGGRAQNLDPRSDTNINTIGRKTKRESASGYATVTQCKDLAEWRLKRSGVLQKAVNISCSQMFHIELNSLVEIVRTDKPGAPTERHLIQGYSRPLATNGAMTITAVSVNDFPIATVSEWPTAT